MQTNIFDSIKCEKHVRCHAWFLWAKKQYKNEILYLDGHKKDPTRVMMKFCPFCGGRVDE